jgi:PmbA protein
MDGYSVVDAALAALKAEGADKAQASLSLSSKSELNVDAGTMSLLRTTMNAQLSMTAIAGGRKGSVSLNKVDEASIRSAAAEAVDSAGSSAPDEANDVSPAASGSFAYGDGEPDMESMYSRLREYLDFAGREFPKTRLEQCILDFTRGRTFFGNSNGARLDQSTGLYAFFSMFTSKDGGKTSSFNYSGAERRRLDRSLSDWGLLAVLMRQSAEQTETRPLSGKFLGEIVVTPHCLGDFIEGANQVCLGDYPQIAGTSPWKGKLGGAVASPLLTLRSAPVSGEIASGWFFTGDGFPAEDCAVIEGGVLRNCTLSHYGSRKTGLPRCPSGGGAWVVEPGAAGLEELVGSVERGLLLCRFSGGEPSDAGDFTGVAKNSYFIEGGKIAYPVSETMVSGNLCSALRDIQGISRERVDFGSSVYPWVKMGGITISGS